MIRQTAAKHAPWYVVPADNKWYTRLIVSSAIINALTSLDLAYPKVGKEKMDELKKARKILTSE